MVTFRNNYTYTYKVIGTVLGREELLSENWVLLLEHWKVGQFISIMEKLVVMKNKTLKHVDW